MDTYVDLYEPQRTNVAKIKYGKQNISFLIWEKQNIRKHLFDDILESIFLMIYI